MAGFKQYGLGDLFDAFASAGNSVINSADTHMQEQAALDLDAMQNQFQTDVNDELNKLNESNNWENWEQDMDDFLDKTAGKFEDKNSPYYCRNNYTATRAKSMLEGQRPQLQQKVHEMQYSKQREHNIQNFYQSITADKNNGVPTQQRLDNVRTRAKALYDLGNIGEEDFNNIMDSCYSSILTDSITDGVTNLFESGVNSDKSFNEIWTTYKKQNPEALHRYGLDGLEVSVDPSEIEKKCKNTLEQNYSAYVRDVQDKNSEKLSEIYTNMRSQESWQARLNIAETGQALLSTMKGLKLSEQDRNMYAAYFDLEKFDSSGNSKTSGSGALKASDFDKFETYFKNMTSDGAFNIWKNGIEDANGGIIKPSLYLIEAACRNKVINDWLNKDYSENFDKDKSQRESDWKDLYAGRAGEPMGDYLAKQVTLQAFAAPYAAYILGDTDKIKKDLKDKKLPADDAAVSDWISFMRDAAFSATGDTKSEDFKKLYDQHVNSFYLAESKYLTLDKNGEINKKLNPNSTSDVLKAVQTMNNYDFVYTDENGNEIWNQDAKKAIEAKGGVKDVLRGVVAKNLHLNSDEEANINWRYTKTADDMNSNIIFSYNGKDYIVQQDPNNKKNYQVVQPETGKVEASNQHVMLNGREYTASYDGGFRGNIQLKDNETGEILNSKDGDFLPADITMENIEKLQPRKERIETRQEISDLKEERKENYEEAVKTKNEIPSAVKLTGSTNEETWKKAGPAKRKLIVSSAIDTIDEEAEEAQWDKSNEKAKQFKDKYGVRIDQWKTMSKNEKQNQIIKF